MSWIEWMGYLASVLIAASLMMSSIVKLRWLNLAGAAMFSSYGFVIGALPVALLNGFIVLTNIYYLNGIYRRSEHFRLVAAGVQDPLVQYWLGFYREQIQRHFPGLEPGAMQNPVCALMLRNSEVVGILVGEQREQTFEVALDYVFPAYQDFKTGHYLYHQSGFFSDRKVDRVAARSTTPKHQAYLVRMGFERVPGSADRFLYQAGDPGRPAA